jgi:hypothetical protein
MRSPQGLLLAGVKSVTPENVRKFSILENETRKIRHSSSRMFNIDETGIAVVQRKRLRVRMTTSPPSVNRLSKLNVLLQQSLY